MKAFPAMGDGSGQKCQEVTTPRSSPQPLSRGNWASSPVVQLLYPLVETSLKPVLCKVSEVLRGHDTHCSKQQPSMYPVLTSFLGLSHLSTSQVVYLHSNPVRGSDSGEFQLKQTVIIHRYIQTFEIVLYIRNSLQIQGDLNVSSVFFERSYSFQQIFKWFFDFSLPPRIRINCNEGGRSPFFLFNLRY